MNKRLVRVIAIFALLCFGALFLSSCSAKGSGYATMYAYDQKNNPTIYEDQVDWAELKIAHEIIAIEKERLDDDGYNGTYSVESLDELEKNIRAMVLNANTGNDYTSYVAELNKLANEITKRHEESLVGKTEEEKKGINNPIANAIIENIIKGSNSTDSTKPAQYVDYLYVSGKKDSAKAEENFKVILIKADIERFEQIFINAGSFDLLSTGIQTTGENVPTLTAEQEAQYAQRTKLVKMFEKKGGCFSATSSISADAQVIYEKYQEEVKGANIYEALVAFMLDVEMRQLEQEPIRFQLRFNQGFGVFVSDFFGNFFDNFLVYPVGFFLWLTSSLFGGWYVIGLFVTTILIRTAGWPIYAKTNDMSLKMQVIQPEMQKLEEKYKNRQDPDSQRMKQAELAQIYKKNKIGLGGCFLPFLQFPIFMAVYGAVRRFPYTVATGSVFTADWANTSIFGKEINSTLFGLPFDLFKDYASGETAQLIGIIVLVILVCGTQFLSQFLSERRQKTNHERSQEDIPAYRRQAYKQNNNQGANTMKYVMYMMIFMMGTFVFTSKAGLGIYWLIGNLYSMLQMFINNELGQRKLKKMKEKAKENR